MRTWFCIKGTSRRRPCDKSSRRFCDGVRRLCNGMRGLCGGTRGLCDKMRGLCDKMRGLCDRMRRHICKGGTRNVCDGT
jgi:hypothetical protein